MEMSIHILTEESSKRRGHGVPVQERLKNAELFLLLLSLRAVGARDHAGHDRLGLIRASAGIDESRFDIDIRLFARLGEEGAKRGLQFFIINILVDLVLYILLRGN